MSPKLLADVWLFVVCSPWRAPRWLGTPGKVPGNTCSLATWSTCSHRLPSARHCVPLLSRDSAASCSRCLCEAALSFHSLPSGRFPWTRLRGLRWASPPGAISVAHCSSAPCCDVSSEP